MTCTDHGKQLYLETFQLYQRLNPEREPQTTDRKSDTVPLCHHTCSSVLTRGDGDLSARHVREARRMTPPLTTGFRSGMQ